MFVINCAPASARSVAGGPGCHRSSQIVEDAVVRQEALAVRRLDFAGGADRACVVEVAVEVGEADERGQAPGLARYLSERLSSGADEAGAEEEVLRWVARNGEFGEEDEVGAGGSRFAQAREDLFAVPVQVADCRIDLCKREPHRF
jgi:hypothetical protein